MNPTVKITARQIRFLLGSKRVWAIQSLHVRGGVPTHLRGYYAVPLAEERRHAWGRLDGASELAVLRDWAQKGFQQTVPNQAH